jgi:cytidyltransferase-like protein
MSNKISFKDFLQLVDDAYNHYSFELRYGQTIMNTLYNVWPEKYKELVASKEDCFYDDGSVKLTLDELEKTWMNKQTVGVTNGVFDLFHRDHKSFIDICKSNCDYLIVYLDIDDFVENNKKQKPILDYTTRSKALLAYGVNEVRTCNSWEEPFDTNFDVFFVGSDQLEYPQWKEQLDKLRQQNKLFIKETGVVHSKDLKKLISPYLTEPNPIGLQEVINILTQHNIIYCAMFGTLLGIMRNNKKIPWDKDYDLVIFDTAYKEVADILTRENFKIQIHRHGFIEIHEPCRVDLFLYNKTENKAHFDTQTWPIFASDIYPIIDSSIDDISIKIPNNSKKIIDTHYPNWQTNFNVWHSWKPKEGDINC